MIELTVNKENEGQRLDIFITISLDGYSRSFIKKQIMSGHVFKDSLVFDKLNYRVSEGERFVIELDEQAHGPGDFIVAQNISLDIVYEDSDLVVVNKPSGMVSHPATGNWDNTLINALLYRYKDFASVGDKIRHGLIHRIDKDTSGLIMVGKTNKALWFYSKMFAERQVHKTYLAIVKGALPERLNGLVIKNYLGRNEQSRKKFSVVEPNKGRYAETQVLIKGVVEYNGSQFSVLEVSPKTGRTHQIRVHLADLGFPILGDDIYARRHIGLDFRLMLHAWKITTPLVDSSDMLNLEADIPSEFELFTKKML